MLYLIPEAALVQNIKFQINFSQMRVLKSLTISNVMVVGVTAELGVIVEYHFVKVDYELSQPTSPFVPCPATFCLRFRGSMDRCTPL